MRRGEIIIAICIIGVSIAMWINSAGFIAETSMVKTLSAAFYPRLLVICIIICALILMVRAFRARTAAVPIAWGQWYKVPIAAGVMLFQVFTFEELGWAPSAWITIVLLMRITRVKLWKSLLIPTGFIVFVYLFFILFLQLQFPTDFLPTLPG